ncbi:CIA30 family protein [Algoriphagus yeomjeoni]|uniref:CIA30 family protein n=1 Tax=Algoriphagus yeomjeoni TaxID=291403 RepID=UPI003CE5AFF6
MKALLLTFFLPLLMSSLLVFDFSANSDWSVWEIENDTVMGGVSASKLSKSEAGHAVFTGTVSLENDGGFASMQYHFAPKNISGYTKAVIRIKGDGKDYQFRIKANLKEWADYIYTFHTTGEWQSIEIPLNKMEPSYHGNKLNIPNFNADQIQEVRFMIGNGKSESFRLEVDKIELQ